MPRPPTFTPLPASVGPPGTNAPHFSDVAPIAPAETVAYLAGKHSSYLGPGAILDFSPSDILETMDTVVLDDVKRQRGAAALQQVYDTIANAVLAALREQYGERWVLVPLDAGHGGRRGIDWDGGAAGTEADHNRAVVAAMRRLAQSASYSRLILRPIFDDAVDADFRLPAALNRRTMNPLVLRQSRASMLASQATAWNARHPDPALSVAVHEIAVHFNAGAGGALVLHQGPTVRPDFAARSLDFARRYLGRAVADLNATALLPSPLRLWGGTGLHDDVMMYRPDYLSDEDISGLTPRYAGLQGGGYLPRYVDIILAGSPFR